MTWIVTAGSARTALARTCLLALVFAPVLALQACATLEAKQSQLALRPTPGRPAGLPDDTVLFRPGDQRRLVAVASADPAAP